MAGRRPLRDARSVRAALCALLLASSVSAADRSGEEGEAPLTRGGAQIADGLRADLTEQWRSELRRGEALRRLGSLDEAFAALEKSLDLARRMESTAAAATSLTALGATSTAAGDRERALEVLTSAERQAREAGEEALLAAIANERGNARADGRDPVPALDDYAEAVDRALASRDVALAHGAAANRAHLAARLGTKEEASQAIGLALRLGTEREDPADTDARIRVAHAVLALARRSPASAAGLLADVDSDLDRVAALAEASADAGSRSWALGTRAEIAELEGRTGSALALVDEALRAAQLAGNPEAELRWLAIAGGLERQLGDTNAAAVRYARALEIRSALRRSVGMGRRSALADLPDVDLEPTDLLLERAARAPTPEAAERDLLAAQRVVEGSKSAGFRDYFRDDCVDAYRAMLADPARASATAAVVYPVPLPDRLEILVSSTSGIRRFSTPVGAEQLRTEVRNLRELLTKRTTHQYLRPARTVYDWLVAPIRAHLDALGVDTLVFVPSGALRTIPPAALHDGERFLVESFALAVTPGLELTDPRPIEREGLTRFLGGLSSGTGEFAPLPHVPGEIAAIGELYEDGVTLLDERFEIPAIERTLRDRDFSVVHLATHGQFGATPADTFLLTHDGRLSMEQLSEYVGAFRYRETPLDLIVLSACETAAGDEQAALGLAGIAIRSGARSAVGSLWAVADVAASRLVTEFYRQLHDSSASRASALQRAQLELLAERATRHPAYWAPFLLIGSWL